MGEQVVLRRFMQAVGAVEYASAVGCNLFVAEAVNFIYKFTVAAAGIHYVAVAVAECRQYHAAAGVDTFLAFSGHGQRVHGAVGVDGAVGRYA